MMYRCWCQTQQLAHQVQAWRSLTASSKTLTRCGAGAAGTMLASGADRALQLGLRILAACAPGRRGAPVPAPAAAAAGPPGAGLVIAYRFK